MKKETIEDEVINLSDFKNRPLTKGPSKDSKYISEINEYGEISINSKPSPKKPANPWPYRFFLSMVVFLAVMLLLENLLNN